MALMRASSAMSCSSVRVALGLLHPFQRGLQLLNLHWEQLVTARLAHAVANGSPQADAWSLIFSALMTFRIVENSGFPAGESAL